MKKIYFLVVLLAIGMMVQAQELNENAKFLKTDSSEDLRAIYNDIKEAAVKHWGDDHNMIVFTINNQCDAYFEMVEVMQKSDYDKTIMENAVKEWGEYLEDEGRVKADWVMVMFTYKNQLKAKNAY